MTSNQPSQAASTKPCVDPTSLPSRSMFLQRQAQLQAVSDVKLRKAWNSVVRRSVIGKAGLGVWGCTSCDLNPTAEFLLTVKPRIWWMPRFLSWILSGQWWYDINEALS